MILLRNKRLLTPTDLLSLFFGLLRSQDKELRKFLESHIVSDIKNLNSKHKDAKLNRVCEIWILISLNMFYFTSNLFLFLESSKFYVHYAKG